MISTHFRIENPWAKDDFSSLWDKSWLVASCTAIELQCIKYSYNIFEFQFAWNIRSDHAGVKFNVGIFGYSFHFDLYDTRHWDREKSAWEKYNE